MVPCYFFFLFLQNWNKSDRLLPNTCGLQQVDDYEQVEHTFRKITKVGIDTSSNSLLAAFM